MRKPKVWGRTVRGRRWLVCAANQRAAVKTLERAMYWTTLREFRGTWQPANAAECRLATEPGVWQELASGWRRVL